MLLSISKDIVEGQGRIIIERKELADELVVSEMARDRVAFLFEDVVPRQRRRSVVFVRRHCEPITGQLQKRTRDVREGTI